MDQSLRDLDSVDVYMQFVNDVLRKLHGLFRNCLDFQSISPQLRSHNLLTDHQWQVIGKKDSREQQVDEFLKYLPHKGRNCLHQLMKCLQCSLDHAGHQDLLIELKKIVEKQTDDPIADILENGNPQDSDQDEFEQAISKLASTVNNLYSNKTKALKQKIEQQKAEIKRLELNCTNFTATLQQLEETILNLKSSNDSLKVQLQDKESLLENLNTSDANFESEVSFEEEVRSEVCEEETAYDKRISSLSFSYSSPPSPQMHRKRRYTDLPNQHTSVDRHLSLEEKMKAYQQKLKGYHSKCQSLEMDKKSLKDDKRQLEWEVSRLKEQLDTVSISSHSSLLSHHKGLHHSCSSIYEKADVVIQAKTRHECDKGAVEENSTSVFSRFTSIIKNRASRAVSNEPPTNRMLEISDIFPNDTDEDYLNPICQGWLVKEGGSKKSLRKRWFVLSSRFFFYFEKEELHDFKRPLGILPLTPDMQVADSAKENWFEIFKKSRTNMKSCKLDKNKGGYIPGNHVSYNLQASCEEDKKKWTEVFHRVFETLNTSL